jgi:malonyl-CoA/methylmalonyl-CoA synthetase
LEEWRKVTGRSLLERYGMTEIGMALSNPYDESKHKPGFVGLPLPGVHLKLASIDDATPTPSTESDEYVEGPGELLVKGDNLFSEYFDNPQATAESFDSEGYFKTGDVVAKSSDGFWRILGRASVDILKIGGFKVSALEIEARLLENPSIAEVAVIGIPDEAYGQRAVALVVLALDMETGEPVNLTEGDIISWVRKNLSSKMHIRHVKFAEKMPRNAMGKINKKDLQRTVFKEFFS